MKFRLFDFEISIEYAPRKYRLLAYNINAWLHMKKLPPSKINRIKAVIELVYDGNLTGNLMPAKELVEKIYLNNGIGDAR